LEFKSKIGFICVYLCSSAVIFLKIPALIVPSLSRHSPLACAAPVLNPAACARVLCMQAAASGTGGRGIWGKFTSE